MSAPENTVRRPRANLRALVAVALIASLVTTTLTLVSGASATTPTSKIYVAVAKKTGEMRILSGPTAKLYKGEYRTWWNQVGPAGPVGAAGLMGPMGLMGPKGDKGDTGTVSVPDTIAGPFTVDSGLFTAKGGAALKNGADVTGGLTADTLTVTGASLLQSGLTVTGGSIFGSFGGNLTGNVTGNLSGTTVDAHTITATQHLYAGPVGGPYAFAVDSSNGNTALQGTLDVQNALTVHTGGADITGNSTIHGDANVTGNLTAGNIHGGASAHSEFGQAATSAGGVSAPVAVTGLTPSGSVVITPIGPGPFAVVPSVTIGAGSFVINGDPNTNYSWIAMW